MRNSLATAFLMSVIAGCSPDTPAPAGCAAPDLQYLVGQPEDVLTTMKFGVPIRVIHPGDAVTMDFQSDRLNFIIGESGKIEKIECN